jgi:hypothetical protein
VPARVAIGSLHYLGDAEGFRVRETHHLPELPALEEEGFALALLGVSDLARAVKLALLEVAVEALTGVIQL